jgi:hypothetical protein
MLLQRRLKVGKVVLVPNMDKDNKGEISVTRSTYRVNDVTRYLFFWRY